MDKTIQKSNVFKHGSTWLRADFHLHTKADKEFEYPGDENNFINNYIDALKQKGIQIGIITNHNKFDLDEFKALRKKGRKNGIYLWPGVELSVGYGSNGVHTLICFSEGWIENGDDHINSFLISVFPGKTPDKYENDNGRTDGNIIDILSKLEEFELDFFVVFAHVEARNGLWNEIDGGRFKELGSKDIFKRRTFGFQKVRTRDKRKNVQNWLGEFYPAELEGSDCKSIEDIGRGQKCYIKIGHFSFGALKYALHDKKYRVTCKKIKPENAYIESVRVLGTNGSLSEKEINFSPDLNTLIGIRGSGKSSILEVVRYALNIELNNSDDVVYKQKLVDYALGSGGIVEVDIIDRFNKLHTVRRANNNSYSEIMMDGEVKPGVSIGAIISKPLYFGQKDLSSTDEDSKQDFIDRIIGDKLKTIRNKIIEKKKEVKEAISNLKKVEKVKDSLENEEKKKKDLKYKLEIYEKHGITDKLQKRLKFDKDLQKMARGIDIAEKFVEDVRDLLSENEDELRNYLGYKSDYNSELFEKFYDKYQKYIFFLEKMKSWLQEQKSAKKELLSYQEELKKNYKEMSFEFAEIEQDLAEQLHKDSIQNIKPEDFRKIKIEFEKTKQNILILQNKSNLEANRNDELQKRLSELNELWHQEFNQLNKEMEKINSESSPLSIEIEFKNNKDKFLEFMKDIFKGTNIHTSTFQKIVDKYTDFIDIYKDWKNAESFFGTNPHIFSERFQENLNVLLTYRVPDRFKIKYHNKELSQHSVGQRASALILLILSQKDNDLIIIDQPEDDLDNQTIYKDVIILIRKLKPDVQFIFATHNPNIPVLGDAELVNSCTYKNDKIFIESGSIDNHDIQKNIIDIMEGGEDAFKRRKEIYNIWKP